ncbi:sensor histidine kinase [candidate division TA06 bacterium]|uniref:histidine kinase n=1 Tax=candidate division TA06 bacterium TaxID=2250710 RepID=A0A523XEC2_UNCT6|nr:MAG: sensor histidine kinase [candidate division TA06 bacterium]
MKKSELKKILVLVAMVTAITLLHYMTSTRHYVFHNVYVRLYYAPIIISAFWFGLRGAVATGLFVSLAYLPHVLIQWAHDTVGNPNRYLEIVLFNVIGLVVGTLAQAERTHRQKLAQTARELEESYARLQNQTERLLEMEAQLMHADRLSVLGELSAAMAHEVRNPLASIKGTVDILKDGKTNSKERDEFLGILSKEVERLNRVADGYLTLARRAPSGPGHCDLQEVVRSVVALVEGRARKQGVTIEVSHEAGAETVPINPDLLRQILLNLVINSFAAMTEGGKLAIISKQEEQLLTISVTDTGSGISEENLGKVFETFFTSGESGSGLGLPIVKRIMEDAGGKVDLSSRVGEGTTVDLMFTLGEEK